VLTKTGDVGAVDSRRRKQEMRIKFWVESWRGKRRLEDLCKDGRIILKLIVKNYGKNLWTILNWLRIRLKQMFGFQNRFDILQTTKSFTRTDQKQKQQQQQQL